MVSFLTRPNSHQRCLCQLFGAQGGVDNTRDGGDRVFSAKINGGIHGNGHGILAFGNSKSNRSAVSNPTNQSEHFLWAGKSKSMIAGKGEINESITHLGGHVIGPDTQIHLRVVVDTGQQKHNAWATRTSIQETTQPEDHLGMGGGRGNCRARRSVHLHADKPTIRLYSWTIFMQKRSERGKVATKSSQAKLTTR